jgi:SAM-dependent methyltransferase
MTFADHFSKQANAYAAYRPTYPDALGAWLASITPGRSLAWDCATGSGQAATMLANHFEHVAATDASAAQIDNAEARDRVEYGVARADASGLPGESCDLVTVAQAAHWLDLPVFYEEVRRVLKPGGVLALWCYVLMETGHSELDAAIRHFQYDRVGPYWPPGRELVEDRYQSLPFPFEAISAPPFEMAARWTRDELVGYVGTWSAVARCREVEGIDPVLAFAAEVDRLWPGGAEALDVRWPVYVRVGMIPRA